MSSSNAYTGHRHTPKVTAHMAATSSPSPSQPPSLLRVQELVRNQAALRALKHGAAVVVTDELGLQYAAYVRLCTLPRQLELFDLSDSCGDETARPLLRVEEEEGEESDSTSALARLTIPLHPLTTVTPIETALLPRTSHGGNGTTTTAISSSGCKGRAMDVDGFVVHVATTADRPDERSAHERRSGGRAASSCTCGGGRRSGHGQDCSCGDVRDAVTAHGNGRVSASEERRASASVVYRIEPLTYGPDSTAAPRGARLRDWVWLLQRLCAAAPSATSLSPPPPPEMVGTASASVRLSGGRGLSSMNGEPRGDRVETVAVSSNGPCHGVSRRRSSPAEHRSSPSFSASSAEAFLPSLGVHQRGRSTEADHDDTDFPQVRSRHSTSPTAAAPQPLTPYTYHYRAHHLLSAEDTRVSMSLGRSELGGTFSVSSASKPSVSRSGLPSAVSDALRVDMAASQPRPGGGEGGPGGLQWATRHRTSAETNNVANEYDDGEGGQQTFRHSEGKRTAPQGGTGGGGTAATTSFASASLRAQLQATYRNLQRRLEEVQQLKRSLQGDSGTVAPAAVWKRGSGGSGGSAGTATHPTAAYAVQCATSMTASHADPTAVANRVRTARPAGRGEQAAVPAEAHIRASHSPFSTSSFPLQAAVVVGAESATAQASPQPPSSFSTSAHRTHDPFDTDGSAENAVKGRDDANDDTSGEEEEEEEEDPPRPPTMAHSGSPLLPTFVIGPTRRVTTASSAQVTAARRHHRLPDSVSVPAALVTEEDRRRRRQASYLSGQSSQGLSVETFLRQPRLSGRLSAAAPPPLSMLAEDFTAAAAVGGGGGVMDDDDGTSNSVTRQMVVLEATSTTSSTSGEDAVFVEVDAEETTSSSSSSSSLALEADDTLEGVAAAALGGMDALGSGYDGETAVGGSRNSRSSKGEEWEKGQQRWPRQQRSHRRRLHRPRAPATHAKGTLGDLGPSRSDPSALRMYREIHGSSLSGSSSGEDTESDADPSATRVQGHRRGGKRR